MFRRILSFVTNLLLSRYRPRRPPSKLVAIVVPVFNRPELTPDEEISLRHLRRFLDSYDKFLIAPKGLNFELSGFTTLRFSRKYYGTGRRHSRLLYQLEFYENFKEYKYILMHHLDALVFSNELEKWCGTDVDYVGAPWIPFADAPKWLPDLLTRTKSLSTPGANSSPWEMEPQVGCGGLALMKVEAVLAVLLERYRIEPGLYWKDRLASLFEAILQPFTRLTAIPAVDWRIRRWSKRSEISLSNDEFWSFHAVRYLPTFRIPDWKTALRFAFEVGPRQCFELNESKLPFGCHRWPDYDRDFWEPYLLKE